MATEVKPLPDEKTTEPERASPSNAVVTGNSSGEATGEATVLNPNEDLSSMNNAEGSSPLPVWREKAGDIINQSSLKIKEAATKAGTAVAGAAEVTGSRVRTTWQSSVQPRVSATWQSTKEGWQSSVQPRVDAAAKAAVVAGVKLKMGMIETRDRVASAALHRKIAEATKNSLERSRTFLVRMEILPPELNPRAVFGVPLEKVISYQSSGESIPHIVVACVEFIEKEGLSTEFLFDDEGDPAMVTRLMKIYERDDQADVPLGFRPQDVAQVLLAFFRCLPEPVLTYELYDDVVAIGGSDVLRLKAALDSLPAANLATVERIARLLRKIAKEHENVKMDSEALANEWAPVFLWRKGGAPATSLKPTFPHKDPIEGSTIAIQENMESESAEKPIVEATPAVTPPEYSEVDPLKDHSAIAAAVRILIEQYEIVFAQPQV